MSARPDDTLTHGTTRFSTNASDTPDTPFAAEPALAAGSTLGAGAATDTAGHALAAQKRKLRRTMRELLAALPPEERATAAQSAARAFLTLPEMQAAPVVLAFLSYGTEIETRALIQELLERGKQVALPRTESRGGAYEMDFYVVGTAGRLASRAPAARASSFGTTLERGEYGILAPPKDAELYEPPRAASSTPSDSRAKNGSTTPHQAVMLVPGLAFSAAGGRLGKGKGYYDRYLARLAQTGARRPLLVGYGFSAQVLPSVPMGATDIPLDLIVTENGVVTATR